MVTQLTKEQIEKLSRGYEWHPEMEFTTFCDLNMFPTYSNDAEQLFNDIDKEYCVLIHEQEFNE